MDASSPSPSSGPQHFQSATQWLKLLRERRIGAVELLALHLAQLDRHHDRVNAVVARDIEGAMRAARAADNTPAGQRQALHGLPMTVKDTLEAVGMPATCGLPALANHLPQQDADAVARLKAAGAIVYGKTNVPPGAFDWQSSNPVYGTTRNPWNVDRSAGGSSGGSAAAVTAGFTPLELGSDIGGSIRVPAAFCGIYGHKPSFGIVPIRGHIPPMPGRQLRFEMGVLGPLARSAADLELALDVLVAPSVQDQAAWRIDLPPSRHDRLQDFRVGVWIDDDVMPLDAGCRAAMQAWVDDLQRLGVQVDRGARPDIDWQAAYDTYTAALFQLMGADTPREHLQQMLDAAAALPTGDNSYPARVARALKLRYFEYFDIVEQRHALYRRWHAFFTRYDLLICPAFPSVAYPHDHRGDALDPIGAAEARRMTLNGVPHPYLDGLKWPSLATVADLPSTAVPTGRLVEGMPLGVQVIGPYLEDRTPLRFAQLLEQALGGATPPPAFVQP